MPISRSKKAVFVHIPKTAGTTIEKVMGMQNIESLYSTCKNEKYKVCPQHLYASEILELAPVTKQYYWFTVVRHPLDRLVSEYHYIQNTNCMASKFASLNFNDFVNCLNMPISDRMFLFDRHLEPQVNFIKDAENIEVFKFEQIDTCFKQLQYKFHIPFFTHERKKRNMKTSESYYTAAIEEKVKDFYKEDFKAFNYE